MREVMANESLFREAIDKMAIKREESGIDKNGKKYSMVKDRIEVFRQLFGDAYGIDTNVYVQGVVDRELIVATAKIVRENGNVVASGTATGIPYSDEVMSAAPFEAVETAAIGRALAVLGLHGGEFASDTEMTKVPDREVSNKKQVSHSEKNMPVVAPVGSLYIPSDNDDLANKPDEQAKRVIEELKKINNGRELQKYYSALAAFRKFMEYSEMKLELAELRAAFQERDQQLEIENG